MARKKVSPEPPQTTSPRRSPTRQTSPPAKALAKTSKASAESKGTPAQTLYIRNLNEKIHKQTLKEALYYLFAQYGRVIDIVTLKTIKMRGQAHVVYQTIPEAAAALKALDGTTVFKKQLDIHYAKSRSRKAEELERRQRFEEAEDETEVDPAWSTAPLLRTGKVAPPPTDAEQQDVEMEEVGRIVE